MRPGGFSPGPGSGWRGAVSSLANREFRWLLSGNTAFFFAMQAIAMVIRPTLAYELSGRSPAALGVVGIAVAIPMLVLSPLGGALAERMDKRSLILGVQGAILLGELATVALIFLGWIRYWHLVVVAMTMGSMFALMMPARQALVVTVVGKTNLSNAVALNVASMNVTRIVGPAAAGFLMHPLGIPGAYASAVALYLIALLTLLGVRPAPPAPDAREMSIGRSLAEAVSYLRAERLVLLLLLFGLLPMLLMMPFQTLLAVFANTVWDVGSGGLGMLNAAVGVGGIVGSVIIAARGDADRRLGTMLVSVVSFGGFLMLFSLSDSFSPALGLLLVANVFASIFGIVNNTAVQQLIPNEVRGRISAFLMMTFSLPMLGTLPVSLVAEAYGAPAALAGVSVLAVTVSLIFCAASPSLRGLDAAVRRALTGD